MSAQAIQLAGVTLQLDDTTLDAIAALVADRLTPADDGYLDAKGAAAFLAAPVSRIYALVEAGRIPHDRDGSRLLFDKAELREYVKAGGAKRP